MSLLLASGRRNAEKRSSNGLCCYCSKVFKDPRALGGHLRAHRGQAVSKKNLNAPARSSNSLNVTRPSPKPLKAAPLKSSSGGTGSNQSAALSKEKRSVFTKRVGCEHLSSNKLTPKITAKTNNPNYPSGSDRTKVFWSSPVPDPSFTTPSSVPLNNSPPSGSDGVHHLNTVSSSSFNLGNDERVSGTGMPAIKYQNQGTNAIAIPDPHDGSQWLVSDKPTNIFLPYEDRFPKQGEFKGYSSNPVLAPSGKNRYSSEASELPAMMYPPRIVELNPTTEPEMRQKKAVKELLLFKDLGKHFVGLEKFIYETEEVQTDLDLSLHL